MSDVMEKTARLALLGAPNCGKTSLFNALTGGRAKVANYPGVTVEYRKGEFKLDNGQGVELLDLPGVYGDCGHSMDERVAIDAVRGDLDGERRPDGLIFMMDASHITTHLHNVLQAKNYGLPMVLVLNMMDMAARDGIEIDTLQLESLLGIPVVSSVAVRSSGRAHLLDFLAEWAGDVLHGSAALPETEAVELKALQAKARSISGGAVSRIEQAETFTQRIDKVVLHPVIGLVILIAILVFMFQAVYWWAGPFMDAIESGFGALQGAAETFLPDGWLKSLVSDGIIAGVGSVLIFLPQIIILFAFILLLEASGYMARAAFLVDTLMAKVGLNGRAFIPLLSSFACAIPGIMAARTIEQERDVFKDYFIGLKDRAMIFISRAGRIILPASIIIWFLASYPSKSNGIAGTYAGKLGSLIEPILRPIGFNLEIAISLIPGMAAREVVVGALATIYALDSEAIDGPIRETLQNSWSLPTALAFLAWFVFAPQCLSTLAIMKKETNGWKWPLFAFAYLFVLAYCAAGLTYHTAKAFGL